MQQREQQGLLDQLDQLPDSATVPVGWIRKRLKDAALRRPKLITTTTASRLWSYTPEWWSREAKSGRIDGAFQDGDGGMWRLPYTSCEARIAEKQDAGNPKRRRRREPWSKASASSRRARSEDL